jgi:hypothetical protein
VRARHSVAIGLVGGFVDLISDWLLDADPAAEDQVETLIEDRTAFDISVRHGLAPGQVRSRSSD